MTIDSNNYRVRVNQDFRPIPLEKGQVRNSRLECEKKAKERRIILTPVLSHRERESKIYFIISNT